MKLELKRIVIDAGTQTRLKIDDDTVTDYAEAMTEGAKFPPVIVFKDGEEYLLADGFHRYLAADKNGWRDIETEIRKGGKLEAIKYGLGANTTNGLRRTNQDKRNCVEIAFNIFPDYSPNRIVELCGVSLDLVQRMQDTDSVRSEKQSFIGKDGKSYPASKVRTARDVFHEAERETNKGGDKQTKDPLETRELGNISESFDDKDSTILFHLKRYWKQANKKDKKLFKEWINENND